MSRFNNYTDLLDRSRSTDSDDGHESGSSADSPATPEARKYASQADIKQLNPHYLCPNCDTASRAAANISMHWRRKHAAEGPCIIGNVRMVLDGQVIRYKDRTQVRANSANARQNDEEWSYEAVYRRAIASLPHGTMPWEIMGKVHKIYENRPMTDSELDAEIALHEEALAQFTDEKKARFAKTHAAELKARSTAQKLRSKLGNVVSQGRNLFRRSDPRERSPDRPQTANSYRNSSPISGGILRRPTTAAPAYIPSDPSIPIPGQRISSLIYRRQMYHGPRNTSTSSLKSVTFRSKHDGRLKKTDESDSAEEKSSSVSEEE